MRKYHSIKQFRDIIEAVRHRTQFVKVLDNGDVEYDTSRKLPALTFEGQVKLHGTNASVGLMPDGEVVCQSRTQKITIGNDNAGFARYVDENKQVFIDLFNQIKNKFTVDSTKSIYVYGEWVGKGIQKGCGVHELNPSFYLFDIYIFEPENSLDITDVKCDGIIIRNIKDYKTFSINIDFSSEEYLRAAQKTLIEYTESVEKECPVAAQHNVKNGLGEGIVWKCFEFIVNDHPLMFKTKGDKHKVSGSKEKIEIAPEVVESCNNFADYAVTEARLQQAISETAAIRGDMTMFGSVIKWMFDDIRKEEMDVLEKNNLTFKQVTNAVRTKTLRFFQNV